MNHKQERVYVMIKPDGVAKGLIGEIFKRIEQRGLKVVALKMFQPTVKQIDEHYPKDEAWISRLGEKTLGTYEKYGKDPKKELGTSDKFEIGKMVRIWLVDYMISYPLVKAVVQGPHAIDVVRKIAGDTLPYKAAVGTIRGDFSADSPAIANSEKRAVMNVIHVSETPDEAEHEISHWFSLDEIFEYKRVGEEIGF
ncbi:nucleoside-diphosphate kinase [Candidatus Uhrbacteria bacterium RIFCSPLOWO2_01_FULL_47_24]|uniref:nucleoside-diphosphate kinase n=1 Tax=Candidatus Uhrbacteria bacterium RIFCSPLOWO2_01_FULL_47_24 TaxID=1802401 RepID=A0A1F7UV95_9BACT|nr:MAG: nucleoside-diphosphate kinase [Candidatus Uhrbacteria bacterium RIFCSPHIGHO2_01_FULL_47_11]OGL68782.1 MAG: nucleoside-diphosphate kinase [Candidatus Uhrbacteria bacterium RIFCSPHIGHO2_02_FULL_46_47]OGL75244.1 MAG: nucleoside-diphosphate kinase [Candidatus Uhrbacteria bacterium RIFCSPHIGHO2_12_FULL_47_11]OGL81587.1 MAG: nucleoside-diphosphate kinase [Candidatus Uhrbacteria bacterium RIFCSPLOWO2_01_FULL_47_24]OGL83969.1 MAG: nucleoside-diphosphate kinase [Candidatus Uhrbacteria bacterium 